MQFDYDVVAFYGDPKWSAKMADREKYYDQELVIDDEIYTLTVTPRRGEHSFEPVNTNGSQRGWRPIVQHLPHRIKNAKVLDGDDLQAVVTDDFVLIPNPRTSEPDQSFVVQFTAVPMLQ